MSAVQLAGSDPLALAVTEAIMVGSTESAELQHGVNLSGVADPKDIIEYAVAAEEAGWDGVAHIDHLIDFTAQQPDEHQPLNDPWVVWAAVAARTERITLASYVTPIPRRQPWQFARNLATLDWLSDGRVLLGAGLGAPWDFESFGQAYDQRTLAEKYEESLDVITGLWTGDQFSYDGDHYTVDDAILRPEPVQEPRIPIVIGGWWPFKAPFRRGARWDGIIPNYPSMHIDAPYVDDLPAHMRNVIPEEPAPVGEIREMLEWYHDHTDDPGEIILPVHAGDQTGEFIDTARELDATMLVHSPLDIDDPKAANLDRLRDGPPV